MEITGKGSILFAAVCALALAASGCGSGSGPITSASGSAAAIIQGTVNGGAAAEPGAVGSLSNSAKVRVSVAGTNLSTMADSNGAFMLTGVPPGNVTLRFE